MVIPDVRLASDARAMRRGPWRALLEAARPRQWTKNLIVFAPLVFAGDLLHLASLLRVGAAFVLFCLASAAVYLFNDARDAEADRRHPLKQQRPVAAGRLAPGTALRASGLLALVALGAAALLNPRLAAVLAGYGLLMAIYTLWLKRLVLLDVLAIAGGFVLRAAAGAVVIGVPLSLWLYACTVLLSLFLGFGKRRHELALLRVAAGAHRRNLDAYAPALLDRLIVLTAAATILVYTLYTLAATTLPANHAMLLTVPLVLFGLGRYLYLVYAQGHGGAPERVLLEDWPLLLSVLLWGAAAIAVLYIF
ncbi:MAG TPA: decaprenyl-phosphate phosphoribosyltransferase [Thermomicrobiaceae bacterium]|nr:decaprenyl-phosphate phosphoribosyltransferase [Thermomicrobiaceae bacterium]